MITDCYDIQSEPLLSLRDFYGEPGHKVEKCLILFSKHIHQHLLVNFDCEPIGTLNSCNGSKTIYQFCHEGENIGFYLTDLGSALAGSLCYKASWVTGAKKFIMFGSCGSLDREKTTGKFILPTESYRGEGCSYYYAPPADYIHIANSDRMKEIFESLNIPHVQGRVWTTDSMIRETRGLVAQRKSEGCIAVEMELAGVQAVCDFYHLELFDFLEAGDVLEDSGYEVAGLPGANHDLGKLYIALDVAHRI